MRPVDLLDLGFVFLLKFCTKGPQVFLLTNSKYVAFFPYLLSIFRTLLEFKHWTVLEPGYSLNDQSLEIGLFFYYGIGKENVKVLTDDPEYKKLVDESRGRINREMEEYRDFLPIQSKYRSFP